MSAAAALQWLTMLVFAALAGVCVVLLKIQPRLRPLVWAWLAVAVNHVLLYTVAFLFWEEHVSAEITLIWSAASRIQVAFTAGWMLVAIARGRI